MRFNFRGVGRERRATFDDGIGETDDALAALAHARDALRPRPAGRARRILVRLLRAIARRAAVAAQRMVLVGPAVGRFAVGAVPADTIVIHGEEDDVVPLADVFAWARPQELPIVVFPGCGHFFHGRLPRLTAAITGMWHGRPPVLPGA